MKTTAMWRWAKNLLAVVLVPLCLGMGGALVRIIEASGRAEAFWVVFIAGATSWWVIYLLLPKPLWVYVVGHELTHALWAWCFGGRIKRFKASAKGGYVVVSKSNFLIALAPYFFPIYAVLVVLIFLSGHAVWSWKDYLPVFHLALGAAYAFHVTLTWHVLKTKQSDIEDQGYLFSAVVIWLGNVSVLVLAVPTLTHGVTIESALMLCWSETAAVLARLGIVL